MRIRLWFADGTGTSTEIGDLETTPAGIKRYGTHKAWLGNIVREHRYDLLHTLRSTGQDADEQVLREILDYYQRCTFNWAEQIPGPSSTSPW
ncbi:MAG TPA: hypothetical protein VGS80_21200 [Ktedonobacterales bacterium]|nr:hypothetical protein [Ktedonobacterales bacterium]